MGHGGEICGRNNKCKGVKNDEKSDEEINRGRAERDQERVLCKMVKPTQKGKDGGGGQKKTAKETGRERVSERNRRRGIK